MPERLNAARALAPSFGDVLAARVRERESQVVLGLDPDASALWPEIEDSLRSSAPAAPAELAVRAVRMQCEALIDAAGPACVAIKPQLACFERLGAPGRELLGALVQRAHEAGLLVIADGKRGDIDVSARAYAESLFGGSQTPFGAIPGLGADAATVNPLMGADTLEPFLTAARARSAGVLALVRTSNPGAADIQELELAHGGTVWESIAALIHELGRPGIGDSGLSDLGAVVGATAPELLCTARELMPNAVFLLPGIGAQGGAVQDLAPAFAPGPAGGLVSASRSIANAFQSAGGDPASAARAQAERLRACALALVP